MPPKLLTILALLFVSLITMNFRCDKEVAKPFEKAFEIPVDISPLKKSYSLNDTIWLETDAPGKSLFDTKSNQSIPADSGMIRFEATFNEFGTYIKSPVGGFCEIITPAGATKSADRQAQWSTGGGVERYGCGLPNYKVRIGFKPKQAGTYYLTLNQDQYFESCPNKILPFNATVSFKYKNVDLGADIFNALSNNDKEGNSGIKFYTQKLTNRETFVFQVR